jgi:K(+)-stimulated pyrophosphate-energized sodium pump
MEAKSMLKNSFAPLKKFLVAAMLSLIAAPAAFASEADLILPDLGSVYFLGVNGRSLLMFGLFICLFGLMFGLAQFMRIKNLPVHKSMREISELIYETCKTYLITQGKFILLLEFLLAIIIVVYFGWLRHFEAFKVAMIVICSLIGILGSYTVAWFGMRINTYANSRTALT